MLKFSNLNTKYFIDFYITIIAIIFSIIILESLIISITQFYTAV